MNRYEQKVKQLGGEHFGPPSEISESDLNRLDEALGQKLPADYREFLRNYGDYSFNESNPACRSGDLFAKWESVWTGPSDFASFESMLEFAPYFREGNRDAPLSDHSHDASEKIRSLQLLYMREDTLANETAPPRKVVLWKRNY